MVALAFGVAFPERTRRLIVISAAHESDPIATALRHLQRRVIAMTSYLTPRYFEDRLAGCDRDDSTLVEDRIGAYLRTRGEQFADQWTSEKYNALSLSLDLHKIRPEDVTVPSTVIAITSDRLVPVAQSRELAHRLGGPSQLIELDSSFGHDAFLGDFSRVAPFINALLLIGAEVVS
jgi:homoserine O-acetyltransferase